MYMPTMVESPSDGMQCGYQRPVSPVLLVWLFPLFFVLLGGAMVAGTIRAKRARRRWEAAAARAEGEVTDLQWVSRRRSDNRSRIAYPVLRFALPDGRTVETRANSGTNPPQAKPGAQVTVLYDASDPLDASLAAGGISTMIGGVVVALGVILVVVGLASAAFLALLASSVDGL
jgi:hypothetical protein